VLHVMFGQAIGTNNKNLLVLGLGRCENIGDEGIISIVKGCTKVGRETCS
jgi:hypothetical protein